jgi:hypothetical protein
MLSDRSGLGSSYLRVYSSLAPYTALVPAKSRYRRSPVPVLYLSEKSCRFNRSMQHYPVH